MRIDDIRGKFHDPFLYKRFAYNSDGFIELMKFLENENIIDDFCEECKFPLIYLKNALEFYKTSINIREFFLDGDYSFSFSRSKLGEDFWCKKIFYNENFKKIENKLL